ncbi:MAG: ComF family protein [Clostridiales bacterium]|nr:ComF family protein [Clostridiales bacterium]
MNKNRLGRLTEYLISLVFVPKCVICKERLVPGDAVFCSICRGKWESAKRVRCPICGKAMYLCLCTINVMLMYQVQALIKLGYYQPNDHGQIVNQVVYRIKRTNDRRLSKFLVDQLVQGIRRAYGNCEGWIVTYAPRRSTAIKRYGYDQAAVLARGIARTMCLECRPLLQVSRYAKEQKALSVIERMKNAEVSFSVARNVEIAGKNILLVDDVTTSGATLGRCAQLLNWTDVNIVDRKK